MNTISTSDEQFEAQVAVALRREAGTVPVREDGLDRIRMTVTRRRTRRRVSWIAGDAVLVAAATGLALGATRSETQPTPYVDTTTADPTVTPLTIPAEDVPGFLPRAESGYRWSLFQWFGPGGYTMFVTTPVGTWARFIVTVEAPPAGTGATARSTGGVEVTVDRSTPSEVALSWQPTPGVFATVSVPLFRSDVEDPVVTGLALIDSLAPVDPVVWRGSITQVFDSDGVLVAARDQTALIETSDRESRGTTQRTTVDLWAPGHGWGYVALRISDTAPVGAPGEPVTVRGVDGLVRTDDTSVRAGARVITWVEGTHAYELAFDDTVPVADAISIANGLGQLSPAGVDQLLFPTWQPVSTSAGPLFDPDPVGG